MICRQNVPFSLFHLPHFQIGHAQIAAGVPVSGRVGQNLLQEVHRLGVAAPVGFLIGVVETLEVAGAPLPADSRKLPPRVDFIETAYLGLVDPDSAGNLGAGEAYSIDVMETAVAQAIANQGALGMYCNSLMLNKALYGRLPDNPPAPLEDIIDSAVKTGADLSQVVSWNYANSREILESKIPIPALLHQRLSLNWSDRENPPPLPRTSNLAEAEMHRLDRLEAGVKGHWGFPNPKLFSQVDTALILLSSPPAR